MTHGNPSDLELDCEQGFTASSYQFVHQNRKKSVRCHCRALLAVQSVLVCIVLNCISCPTNQIAKVIKRKIFVTAVLSEAADPNLRIP